MLSIVNNVEVRSINWYVPAAMHAASDLDSALTDSCTCIVLAEAEGHVGAPVTVEVGACSTA
jgi:hypothetical protein